MSLKIFDSECRIGIEYAMLLISDINIIVSHISCICNSVFNYMYTV